MYTRWRTDGFSFYPGRMTFEDLCLAYSSHLAAHLYLVLALVTGVCAGLYGDAASRFKVAVAATILAYPLAWYLIHRFVLRGRSLYGLPITAGLWKRAHFDHHQGPQVFNFGYGVEEAKRFPWVARLSGNMPRERPPRARETD
jgi:hypothetical protein